MRIAIDGTPLTVETGGIRRYTERLSGALTRCFPEDAVALFSDQPLAELRHGNIDSTAPCGRGSVTRANTDVRNRAMTAGSGRDEVPLGAPLEGVELHAGRPSSWFRRRWWSYGLPAALDQWRADVFHGVDFSVPYRKACASVLTVHDLSPWNIEQQRDAQRIRSRTPRLMRHVATMIVTPSESVRREVIERFGVEGERVCAIPLAPSAQLTRVDIQPRLPYLLFVGTIEPRKNIEMLVKVWREVRKQVPVDLILIGRLRADSPHIETEPGLHLVGAVDDAELQSWYSGALALVYPSVYEGFGLPLLEAMQCGVPVVASRIDALAEVAGDAALLISLENPRGWIEALVRLSADRELRAELIRRGLARARRFSWEKTALATHAVYIEAMRRFRG
jgi:glycosyltransferase involved in cell wall biosynthesis